MNPKKPEPVTSTRSALNDSSFKKRLFFRLFASSWTIVPFLAGATLLLALWTFSINAGLAFFVGIACLLGALGVFFTRLLRGNERLGKKVIEELQEEALAAREKSLDELDRKLSADGDPRTESFLRDLRALAEAFHKDRVWSSGLSNHTTYELFSGVEQLFKRCILSLDRTLELWYTANNTTTPDARAPIFSQRERIIKDVEKSIRQLGKVLVGIQGIDAGDVSEDSDLARIRDELDQSLKVARAVGERMRSLDQELGTREFDPGGRVR